MASYAVLHGPIIAAGESLSAPLDCTSDTAASIIMPAAWSPAEVLTFQISPDGTTYYDVMDKDGYEITVVAIPATVVMMPVDVSQIGAFVKFRSGSRASPVPQEERREFAMIMGKP
jgi:hypothetical protein